MEEKAPVGFELVVLNEKGRPCANPATKGIPVFKEIFARPRRNGKVNHDKAQEIALNEFLYIYYMIDIRSFAVQRFPRGVDDEQRHHLVRDKLGFEAGWWPDDVIEQAADFYKDFHVTPIIKMLKTAFAAINHTIDYLENVDFTSKNYSPSKVMEYLSNLQDHKKKAEALMQEAIQDINLGGRPKGGGAIGIFENQPDAVVIESYNPMPDAI